MITKQTAEIFHCITQESMDAFLRKEAENGASKNLIRRLKGTLKVICEFLPDDQIITKERLLAWRRNMEDNGYSSATILNYVKYINRYLDFADCSEIRFNQGKAKNITGITFGYLTAIEPTGAKNREDNIWLFQCNCGKTVELAATRVLNGNTLSCGCLKTASLKAAKKYYDGTSIVQSMTEQVKSKRAVSGYVGVAPKRNKWRAYITYKGVDYTLGTYGNIEDAIKARARAKELVMADAEGLLDFYTELEKNFPKLPRRSDLPKQDFPSPEPTIKNTRISAAVRSDNQSGYTGVSRIRDKCEARIVYQGVRYMLGRYENLEHAIAERKAAEALMKENPEQFLKEYSEKCAHHHIQQTRYSYS